VLHADLDVVREAVVRLVHDLVDGDRADLRLSGWRPGNRPARLQVGQPGVEQLGRAGVQRREGADDAGLALRRDQRRAAGDEHRRGDDG
jgi:hypothetical protein